ncbi:FixH family protein [Phenylobacterium sp. LjRoot219]|uniref:FixH family protein n=1 Tax=Phenylobacterium sp. LjRoot219 TaxID=3342283 RepID=UPI003ED0D825
MSHAEPDTRPGFRITGWHVLAGVVGFFAVVIAVDVVFTVLAVRTFPGTVSVTPYEDGLLYNRKLARIAAQEELGWRAAAAAEPLAVSLEVRDRAGAPLSGLAVTGRLERPATEQDRKALTFREVSPGRYRAPAGGLSGAWDLTVEARDPAGRSLEAERRLTWP